LKDKLQELQASSQEVTDISLLRNTAINSFSGILPSPTEEQIEERIELLRQREQQSIEQFRIQQAIEMLLGQE